MDWIELGYWGLFLATFLAATVVPFSSEAILSGALLAGFDPMVSFVVASFGNTLGGITSYGLGYLGNWKVIMKYLRTSEDRVYRWKNLIDRYGAFSALLCWLPFIGDVIAIALGIFRVNPLRVVVWMFVGKALRYYVIIWYLSSIT